MKYLGIDYGSKKTGLAISDPEGRVAMPFRVVPTDDLFSFVASLLASEGIGAIVCGKSLDLDGKANTIYKETKVFTDRIEREIGTPVHFYDERYSSKAAKEGITKPIRRERKAQRSKRVTPQDFQFDAGAASLILQAYIDSQNNPQDEV